MTTTFTPTVPVRSVWLLIDAEPVGRKVHVLVELEDGTHRDVICESWPGPVSYCVHATGINTAPVVENGAAL